MYTRRWLVLLAAVAICLAAQDSPTPSVQVVGAVKQELILTAGDLSQMPRASVRVTSKEVETVYQGVWLHEVLKRAGVPRRERLIRLEDLLHMVRASRWIKLGRKVGLGPAL